MKKAGIISLFSDQNYGNRLQNLAVQTILQNMGYNAHTEIKEFFSFDVADKQLTIERKKFSSFLEKCFDKQVSGNREIV